MRRLLSSSSSSFSFFYKLAKSSEQTYLFVDLLQKGDLVVLLLYDLAQDRIVLTKLRDELVLGEIDLIVFSSSL